MIWAVVQHLALVTQHLLARKFRCIHILLHRTTTVLAKGCCLPQLPPVYFPDPVPDFATQPALPTRAAIMAMPSSYMCVVLLVAALCASNLGE
jgi:hypothetical protein